MLLVLLLILSSVHLFIRLQPPNQVELTPEQLKMIALFEKANSHDDISSDTISPEFEVSEKVSKPAQWVIFDPNTVDSQVLINSGLDHRLAQRIIKYRESGGEYKSASDLEKIYGMDTAWLAEAFNHIEIQQTSFKEAKVYPDFQKKDSLKKWPKRVFPTLELNKADSASFVQLPWVGPFYASEIVKLRNNLGGFRSYDQLLNIYRIRDETIESILEHTTLDTMLIEKININEVDLRRLGYHPYLSWKQARIIINYREQHGDYRSIEEIMKTRVISDSVYLKIAPYLITE